MENSNVTVQFKRKLLMQIKKHPSIWAGRPDADSSYSWKEVQKEMNFLYPLEKLEEIWSNLHHRYYRKIFLKTIERNFEAPTWTFFHDMSFLYERVKETIQEKLGGISPPLFKPVPGSQRVRCPCCIFIEQEQQDPNLDASLSLEFEIGKCDASENFEKNKDLPEDIIDSSDSEDQCFFEFDDVTDQSSNFTNESEIQKNEIEPSTNQPLSSYITQNPPNQISERMDATNQVSDRMDISEHMTANPLGAANPIAPLQNIIDRFIEASLSKAPVLETPLQRAPLFEAPLLGASLSSNAPSFDTSLVKAHLVGAPLLVASNHLEDQTHSNGMLETRGSPKLSSETIDESLAQTKSANTDGRRSKLDQRLMERSRIIEALRANPLLCSNLSKSKNMDTNAAWKRVTEQVGTLPTHIIKNRWKVIRDRYLKELVIQRYSHGQIRSNWECFDKMSFLLPFMEDEIREIDQTRLKMKEAIQNRKETTVELRMKMKEAISEKLERTNSSPPINPMLRPEDTTLKTYINKSKRPAQLPVSDPDSDPYRISILENRLVKVTAIKSFPSLDLTNDNDADDETTISESSNPAKKLRLSLGSGSEKIDEKENSNESNILFSVPIVTPDVPKDAGVKESPIDNVPVEPNQPQEQQPQIIFPPLDLTEDDDDLMIVSENLPKAKPTINKNSFKFQQVFVEQFINTNKVFPMLDLTNEEDDNEGEKDKEESGAKDINHEEKSEEEKSAEDKDDGGVICLDDNDNDNESVGSYEEVFVYCSDEAKSNEE